MLLISKDEPGNCLEFVAMNKCSLVNSNVSHCYQKVNDYSSFKSTKRESRAFAMQESNQTIGLECWLHILTSTSSVSHSHKHANYAFISSLAATEQGIFERMRLVFIYRAITQREWKSYTCLNLALMPNKFQLPVKQQTETSQPSRKLWSDISTHAFQVHYIQQHHCMGPAQRTCG